MKKYKSLATAGLILSAGALSSCAGESTSPEVDSSYPVKIESVFKSPGNYSTGAYNDGEEFAQLRQCPEQNPELTSCVSKTVLIGDLGKFTILNTDLVG